MGEIGILMGFFYGNQGVLRVGIQFAAFFPFEMIRGIKSFYQVGLDELSSVRMRCCP